MSYISSSLSVGNYTLYADDSTCTSSIAKTPVTFTVHPLPILNVVSSNSIVCLTQNAILIVTGANTYTWSNGLNTSSITVSPGISTTYSVTGSSVWGCLVNDTITQFVQPCAGIKERNNINNLKLYPNPVKDILNFQQSNLSGMNIRITNLLGEVFIDQLFLEGDSGVNLGHLPSGIYFISIKQNNFVEVFKFLKE